VVKRAAGASKGEGSGWVAMCGYRKRINREIVEAERVLILDATAGYEELKLWFPNLVAGGELALVEDGPGVWRIQVVGGGFTYGGLSVEPERLEATLDKVRRVQMLQALVGGKPGMIGPLKVEEAAEKSGLLKGIVAAHFHELRGLNAFEVCDTIAVLSRPLPPVDTVLFTAASMYGYPVQKQQYKTRLTHTPVRGGRRVDSFENYLTDARAERVLELGMRAELFQANRGRSSRRGLDRRLVEILCRDEPSDREVDRVVSWEEVRGLTGFVTEALMLGFVPVGRANLKAYLAFFRWHALGVHALENETDISGAAGDTGCSGSVSDISAADNCNALGERARERCSHHVLTGADPYRGSIGERARERNLVSDRFMKDQMRHHPELAAFYEALCAALTTGRAVDVLGVQVRLEGWQRQAGVKLGGRYGVDLWRAPWARWTVEGLKAAVDPGERKQGRSEHYVEDTAHTAT
jgi:hypothetical protein